MQYSESSDDSISVTNSLLELNQTSKENKFSDLSLKKL